jgi:hypothetical protein
MGSSRTGLMVGDARGGDGVMGEATGESNNGGTTGTFCGAFTVGDAAGLADPIGC